MRLILTYLIPCHLLTTHTLPTEALLAPYPRLQKLFLPLSRCIKRGDLTGFDNALAAGEDEFVKRRIYLTLERGRDIALRNLLRKVFVAGGFEEPNDKSSVPVRRTRVTVAEFGAAISIGNKEKLDDDEVECLLANIIYKVSFPTKWHARRARRRGPLQRLLVRHPTQLAFILLPRLNTFTNTIIIEPDERIYRPRARHCGSEQRRRVSRNWHMKLPQ
jgi:hypothetical protein